MSELQGHLLELALPTSFARLGQWSFVQGRRDCCLDQAYLLSVSDEPSWPRLLRVLLQAAAAHALSILATEDTSQAAMAEARTLPALLDAMRETSDAGTLDALVCALGNRICSDGNYKVLVQAAVGKLSGIMLHCTVLRTVHLH